ncbi:hypothetical protein OG564_29425 [Streptomyces sp. NBC_01280]|uniref:hypothetical protein n=1 Tax=Streptomyces sp. NBC_01280 TaxID=2903810 RepID=UPI002E378A71|nr:hypothetical protein [Streptomyces sp. NBC_01280]
MEHEDRALMTALTGEPLLPQDAADPETVAAHAAAQADVALLAEQVRGIGDALAARALPRPAPVVARRPRRRPLAVAFGALAAACAATLLGGLVWLGAVAPGGGADNKSAADHGGAADSGKQGADVTPEGFVACSRLIVEGTVVRVEPVPGAERDTITLTATRYYKPAEGPEKVTFRMDHDVDPRLKPGDRTLISIPKGEEFPDNWAVKAADRASLRDMVVNALPGSRALTCSKAPGPGV